MSAILLISAGLVTDLGLMRIDRQVNKSAADAAALAGVHALNTGDAKPHPYAGVCQAARFLSVNSARFAAISTDTGWTDGNGTATASGCDTTALKGKVCVATDKSTWAVFSWTGTYQGRPVSVSIQSGYVVGQKNADGSYQWADDGLPASDAGATQFGGCDQLAVVIRQSRQPIFGVLAGTSDISTGIRSVGRVNLRGGGFAPAMLLLKQSGCSALTAGASGGGSHIYVKGGVAADGVTTQPGTIHSDADGVGCASNEQVFTGQAQSGIVAFAAPLAGNLSTPDPMKPGQITSYAASQGVAASRLSDSTTNTCGSTALYASATANVGCPGNAGSGHDRVYRKPVDTRYLSAVTGMRDTANTAFASTSSMTTLNDCAPTQTAVDALGLSASSRLFVNCTANAGFTAGVTIRAGTVVFGGKVAPSGALSLPNATAVYVVGPSGAGDAIVLSNGGTFGVRTPTAGACSTAATGPAAGNKAVLVVKNGDFKQTGGNLQLCNTTVLLEGGQSTACLPTAPSTAAPNPTTPCGGSTGTGQLVQTGGNVDWTAPNRYAAMLDAEGNPDATKVAEWSDATGPEDLALWSESGGGSSNPKYQLTGGGSVNLTGVLMTPNAEPLNLSGSFTQTLSNAQYVASSIALSSNNTVITMGVDPNSVITLDRLGSVGLVR